MAKAVSRILALDYGKKRVGIAVSDPLRMIATGLTTLPPAEVIPFMESYFTGEQVDTIVVGYPRQMNNTDSESVTYLKPFLNRLKKIFTGHDIRLYDERFTTKIAEQALIEGGARRKTRQDKELKDKISATILLTSYLEHERHKRQLQ